MGLWNCFIGRGLLGTKELVGRVFHLWFSNSPLGIASGRPLTVALRSWLLSLNTRWFRWLKSVATKTMQSPLLFQMLKPSKRTPYSLPFQGITCPTLFALGLLPTLTEQPRKPSETTPEVPNGHLHTLSSTFFTPPYSFPLLPAAYIARPSPSCIYSGPTADVG